MASNPHALPPEAPPRPPSRLAWLGLPRRELALVAAVAAALMAAIVGFGAVALGRAAAPAPAALSRPLGQPPARGSWSRADWSAEDGPMMSDRGPGPRPARAGRGPEPTRLPAPPPRPQLVSTAQEFSP